MYDFNKISMVHAEITGICNAQCPMCSRYTLDGYVQPELVKSHLSADLFYKLFNSEFIKQIDHVYFSGVYGDPCMHPDLLEFCKHLIDADIEVTVDTNAGYRKPDFWKNLAEIGVKVNFAVDGLKDTNHLYRRNVKWEIVEANMRAFSQANGSAQWNFIVFEHNEHEIDAVRKLAQELNFDFRIKITQKFRHFKTWEVMDQGVKQYDINPPTLEEYRHSNIGSRPFTTHRTLLRNVEKFNNTTIKCKSLERNEIFLNYQGYVLPCCYLGTIHSENSKQIKEIGLDKFSLQHHSVSDIVNNMNTISNSWDKTVDQGKLLVCAFTCGPKEQKTKYVK